MDFIRAWILIFILGGFNNENVFQLTKARNNKISSFKCSCNKEQSCNSFYTGGKTVSFFNLTSTLNSAQIDLYSYLNFVLTLISPQSYFHLKFHLFFFLTLLLRSQLVVQPQHAMLIMKSLMHGVNMVHTILVKITDIINQSNSVMFSKSKYQQNTGPEKDSQ